MKLILNILILAFTLCGVSAAAEAGTLTINASAGQITKGDCLPFSTGAWTGKVNCTLMFNIPVESGKTITNVTFYYFDNATTQSINGRVGRISLSTLSDEIIGSTFTDSSTSNSVQFTTLNVNTVTSSSYSYYAQVVLNSDTSFRGIKINYQ